MYNVWAGQKSRPLRLLALNRGDWLACKARKERGERCRYSADDVDVLYLTVGLEHGQEVIRLAQWARQQGVLVLWNPGLPKNARLLPAPGCVVLQSTLSPDRELEALRELFCSATLDHELLMQRLWAASRASLVLAQGSGTAKKQAIDEALAAQGWRMPRQGTLVASIGSSADCRLEEVVELWRETVEQTSGLEVLWGTAFGQETPDSLRLTLLAVEP